MRIKLSVSTLLAASAALALPLVAAAQQTPPAAGAAAGAAAGDAAAEGAAAGAAAGDAAAEGAAEPACPKCPEPPPPPTTGKLSVSVTPGDATVKLNGAAQKAGVEIEAKPGTHNLEVSKPGYTTWKHSFSLRAGGTYNFAAELSKVPPPPKKPTLTFDIEFGEDAASLTIDGKAVAAKKGEAIEVEPGEHEVKISQKGKKDWVEKLTLAHGQGQKFGVFEAEDADDTLGPYVTIGLGLGLAALGLVFSAEDSGDSSTPGTTGGVGNNTDEDRATAAIVLYTVGGALVATGITLIALQASGDDDSGSSGDVAFIAPYATGQEAGLAGVLSF